MKIQCIFSIEEGACGRCSFSPVELRLPGWKLFFINLESIWRRAGGGGHVMKFQGTSFPQRVNRTTLISILHFISFCPFWCYNFQIRVELISKLNLGTSNLLQSVLRCHLCNFSSSWTSITTAPIQTSETPKKHNFKHLVIEAWGKKIFPMMENDGGKESGKCKFRPRLISKPSKMKNRPKKLLHSL